MGQHGLFFVGRTNSSREQRSKAKQIKHVISTQHQTINIINISTIFVFSFCLSDSRPSRYELEEYDFLNEPDEYDNYEIAMENGYGEEDPNER